MNTLVKLDVYDGKLPRSQGKSKYKINVLHTACSTLYAIQNAKQKAKWTVELN